MIQNKNSLIYKQGIKKGYCILLPKITTITLNFYTKLNGIFKFGNIFIKSKKYVKLNIPNDIMVKNMVIIAEDIKDDLLSNLNIFLKIKDK